MANLAINRHKSLCFSESYDFLAAETDDVQEQRQSTHLDVNSDGH